MLRILIFSLVKWRWACDGGEAKKRNSLSIRVAEPNVRFETGNCIFHPLSPSALVTWVDGSEREQMTQFSQHFEVIVWLFERFGLKNSSFLSVLFSFGRLSTHWPTEN